MVPEQSEGYDLDSATQLKARILIPNGNVKKSQMIDPSEHQEEDKFEKELITDTQDPGCLLSSTQQHAYWKGEGDAKTLREEQSQLMQLYMDTTVNPCEDFYQYACGNWGNHNPIPKDEVAFDTFAVLRESLDSVLRDLLAAQISCEDTEAHVKAKHLYQSCMDAEILEERREGPLLELLDKLGGWPIISSYWHESDFDCMELMARLKLYNNDVLISEWVGPDMKNSDEYIIQVQ